MKFTIERKKLIDAMNYAVYAVENRPMIPVLACGNSMCVNVMQWIGEQIERVEKEMNNG